jgi:hypothetical protein
VGGSGLSAIITAWRDGARRVTAAPSILAGVWLITLAIGVPLTLVLRGMLAHHLGDSMAADSAAAHVNYDWMEEFSSQASGIGVTMGPKVIGFAAVLDNLSSFVDNTTRPIVITGAASAYLVLWLFVAGGILDRYARNRAIRAHGFFAAAGVFFWRFLRLGVVQWIAYGALFGGLHPLLFDRAFPRLTREMSVERNAFLLRLGVYIVFGLVVAAVNLLFDYAKIRAVVEDRRSMLGALGAAARFLSENGVAAGLYALNFVTFLLCLGLYAVIAPGAGAAGWTVWLGFAIGQLYIVARLWVKLQFWASGTAFFQSRLAHAAYIAAPQAVWPESPAAEAIRASSDSSRP